MPELIIAGDKMDKVLEGLHSSVVCHFVEGDCEIRTARLYWKTAKEKSKRESMRFHKPYLYGVFYRFIMRLAHRFNWHYAPPLGPLNPNSGKDYQCWCEWCGFRQSFETNPQIWMR